MSTTMTRCANCGTAGRADTYVIDWRTEMLCDPCIESFNWSDWTFDPVTNTYTR